MPESTLTSKGQITIPKSLRDRFGLQAGDVVEFVEDDHGRIIMRPGSPAGALGLLHQYAPSSPVSIEEMHVAVRQRAALKVRKKK